MEKWMTFTLLYAIFNGWFKCGRKKALEKNSICEVLTIFCTIAFVITFLTKQTTVKIENIYILAILGKSTIISVAWMLELYTVHKMTISLHSIINLSTIIFSTIFSIIFLGEVMTINVFVGLAIVLLGLILVNLVSNTNENKEASVKHIFLLVIACLLNAISAIMDKQLLTYINSTQLLFWFLLFLTIIYWIVLISRKPELKLNVIVKNYWLILTGFFLVLGDNFLFRANEIKESQVLIMTVIKQFTVVELIIIGKFLFHEKNIAKKLICLVLITSGIVVTMF